MTEKKDHFQDLLDKVNKKKEKEVVHENKIHTVMEKKKEILLPIVNFLFKVRNAGVQVYPFEYLLSTKTKQSNILPTSFKYFLLETNDDVKYDIIYPSPLIVIKDPIRIEIGVINPSFIENRGLIHITCGKSHPDNEMLTGDYNSADEALDALTSFIVKNTVSIQRV